MINNVFYKEEWKPIKGYEDFYEVSNTGVIRSKDREVWNGKCYYVKKGRTLRNTDTTTGYYKVELKTNGERKSFKVHRLVALNFIDNPENKPVVNHIDGNTLNNRIDNLEWCTQSENMEHAYSTKLMKSSIHNHLDDIIIEYTSNPDETIRALVRKYGCSHKSITKFLKEKGIVIKSSAETRNKYKIDRQTLIEDFNSGLSNKEIATKHNTNKNLIATYRCKFKKGELKL